jgi:hypothetical protein
MGVEELMRTFRRSSSSLMIGIDSVVVPPLGVILSAGVLQPERRI